MKKLVNLAVACVIVAVASAEITQRGLVGGVSDNPNAARVIGVKAVSKTAGGTLTVSEIASLSSFTNAYDYATNVVRRDVVTRVSDAFVDNGLVYTGTTQTLWAVTNVVVTNVIGTVTNVANYRIGTLTDAGVSKYGPVTNRSCRVDSRVVYSTRPVTNVTATARRVWTLTPFTNNVFSFTLSGGKLNVQTNALLLGGTKLLVGGTAVTNGAAWLILER